MEQKEKTFEESMHRLEQIVNMLERNDQTLDETITLFEEGLQLVKSCDTSLKKFETKVNEIMAQNSEDQA